MERRLTVLDGGLDWSDICKGGRKCNGDGGDERKVAKTRLKY